LLDALRPLELPWLEGDKNQIWEAVQAIRPKITAVPALRPLFKKAQLYLAPGTLQPGYPKSSA